MFNTIKKIIKTELQHIKDEREKRTIAEAIALAKKNKNYVVMIMDARSDDIVCAYQNHYIGARVVSEYLHAKTGIVKTILLGRKDKEAQAKAINQIKEIVAEFMWKMSEIAQKDRETKVADKKSITKDDGKKTK